MATVVQVPLAFAIGSAVFLAMESDTQEARFLLSFLAGAIGLWFLVFLYVWVRHGWRAALSVRVDRPSTIKSANMRLHVPKPLDKGARNAPRRSSVAGIRAHRGR